MKSLICIFSIFLGFINFAVHAQENAMDNIQWQTGPTTAKLGAVAEIIIPEGYRFADADNARALMQIMQNPTSGSELGIIVQDDHDWFALYQFTDSGYVSDDEKNSIDADAILKTLKQGNEAANKERRKKGWSPLTILGWEQRPKYNEITHNLEWAIRGESDGELVINYNTKLLGRGGVMSVTLVTSPDVLQSNLPAFRYVNNGFGYIKGHRYSEFLPSDKKAQYGLTALVAGGTAAAIVKSGAAKWLWKAIVAGVIAIIAFAKSLFSKKDS